MKKKLIILFVLAMSFGQLAFAQLDLVWYKTTPNGAYVNNVRFSNNSKWLMVATSSNLYIYDAITGNVINDTISYSLNNPVFSVDDNHIIGTLDNKIFDYNIITGKIENRFDTINVPLNYSKITDNIHYFLTTTYEGFAIWDIKTGKIVKSKKIMKDTLSVNTQFGQINFLENKSKIILLQRSKYFLGNDPTGNPQYNYRSKVVVYDSNTLDSIACLYDQIETYNATKSDFLAIISISHDENTLALGWYGKKGIILYDFNTFIQKSQIIIDVYSISGIKFTSDDKNLVIAQGSNGDNLSIWDVQSGKLLNQRPGGTYQTLDISNDNKFIGTSGMDQIVLLKFSTTGISNSEPQTDIIYPNPTNGIVTIEFTIPSPSNINYNLYDLLGRLISKLKGQFYETGQVIENINLGNLPTGTYILKIESNSFNKTFKVILN